MEALKQRILEHIADLLDEPTFDMDMRLKGLKDPLPSDKSELHLLMTDAAFKALCTYFSKKDETKQCIIYGVRHTLTEYEKFASGDNYIGNKDLIDKQIKEFIEVYCA